MKEKNNFDKEKDWYKHRLTGNVAENIVEFLINSLPDWKCNRFGVETHINDIKEVVRKNGSYENKVIKKIRKMPDFVVSNEKTGQTFFLEVKYSSYSKKYPALFNHMELEDYNKYWEGTKLIIVRQNKPRFIYIDLEKVNRTMKKPTVVNGNKKDYWDFKEIEGKITDLFHELNEIEIECAIQSVAYMFDV